MAIYTMMGSPVTIVRLATFDDIEQFEGKAKDKAQREIDLLMVKTKSVLLIRREDGSLMTTAISKLKADGGAVEISKAIEGTQPTWKMKNRFGWGWGVECSDPSETTVQPTCTADAARHYADCRNAGEGHEQAYQSMLETAGCCDRSCPGGGACVRARRARR